MAALLKNSTLRTDDKVMKQQLANDERPAGRARARRTALVVGLVAVTIYVVAIVSVVLNR
ncbi:MAG: hypothetical protein ACTHK2_11460 [Dokdonella sp.]|uniref:hypothetical protein n=1 Tax=Dokdonella sp. TaxID=2291710 RepID=UPI003F81C0A9